jgi:hypothetical protein
MADEPEDDSSEYEEDDVTTVQEDTRNPDEFALRGFRLFMDNVEGVAHDREDVLEEQEDMEEEPAKPSPAFIVQKLTEQGITMEDLVKVLLRDHSEYDEEDDEFDEIDERVWGDMRIIIGNYQPQPEAVVPTEPVAEEIQSNITRIPSTPVSAQELAEEKPPTNVTIRQRRHGLMPHLDSISRVLFADEMEE